MISFEVRPDSQLLAAEAAKLTYEVLTSAINQRGLAVWVLAGGSTPMAAYEVLVSDYKDKLDWRKVCVLVGDERCVALGDPRSNWANISTVLLEHLSGIIAVRPEYELAAEVAAENYQLALKNLPHNEAKVPHFDLIWLGLGEDGHTLSLFPGSSQLDDNQSLVVPVHDAPKLPPDRISLTLKALGNTVNCIVMASGAGKADILKQAYTDQDSSLPIVQATQTIDQFGGRVVWLVDQAAASLI